MEIRLTGAVGRPSHVAHPWPPTEAGPGKGEHVLLIAGHFAPESTSGTHRSLHFARALADGGYRVSVVTVDLPSIPSVDNRLSEVFPDEDRVHRVEKRQTVDAIYLYGKDRLLALRRRLSPKAASVPTNTTDEEAKVRKHSFVRSQLSGLVSFPDPFRGWYRPALRAALDVARAEPVHAVFASGPPWTALRVGRAVSRRLRCKLVVDFRDPWLGSGAEVAAHETAAYRFLASTEEARIVASADLVLFNSPDLMEKARAKYSAERASFSCLLNGTDLAPNSEFRRISPQSQLVLRHFGALYGGRSIEPLLQSLQFTESALKSQLRIQLVGPRDRNALRGPELGRQAGITVECLPLVPHSEATGLMSQPSVLLAVQSKGFSSQIPTKLYEYLRTGNPMLVLAGANTAAWQLASKYPRCRRLDFDDPAWNTRVIGELLEEWSSGNLAQVSSEKDTASLSKQVIGREFSALVREVLDGRLTHP